MRSLRFSDSNTFFLWHLLEQAFVSSFLKFVKHFADCLFCACDSGTTIRNNTRITKLLQCLDLFVRIVARQNELIVPHSSISCMFDQPMQWRRSHWHHAVKFIPRLSRHIDQLINMPWYSIFDASIWSDHCFAIANSGVLCDKFACCHNWPPSDF